MDIKSLYEQASAWTAGVFSNVKDDQHGDPTPCPEWNVRELMNHIVGGGYLFAGTAAGQEMPAGDGPPPDMLGDDPAGAYRQSAAGVRAAMDRDGVMDQMMNLPAGELPGSTMFNIATSEALVHGWDLAKATGQDTSFPDDVAEAVYAFTAPGVDFGRQGGFYGPEVSLPEGAPAHQRLVALLGRQP